MSSDVERSDTIDLITSSNSRVRKFLVKGIWLYFLLLIFEGALRKWFLPSLAAPLLIIRDPIAIGLMAYAWYHNIFRSNNYIVLLTIITVISVFTALFIGHKNMYVALYGARIFIIQFPFLFLIGQTLTAQDVLKIGKVLLWISIPMAILVTIQFYSPQSAWVNRGVGGDMEGAGFGGSMGYFRPPGTFSFTNGLVAFFSITTAYVFYFWLKPKQINKLLLICASIGIILMVPFTISRTFTFTVVLMFLFFLSTLGRNRKNLGKILVSLMSLGVLVFVVLKTGWLDTPLEVFFSRFEEAGKVEGGVEGTITNRYFGGMIEAIMRAGERPFFGEGLGLGTNAGSVMIGSGKRTFLIAEEEWARTIGEVGALLGIGIILIRLSLTFKYAKQSFFILSSNYQLPWMLTSFVAINFPQGAWAQPTMLGFSVLAMGLLIASFNEDKKQYTYK